LTSFLRWSTSWDQASHRSVAYQQLQQLAEALSRTLPSGQVCSTCFDMFWQIERNWKKCLICQSHQSLYLSLQPSIVIHCASWWLLSYWSYCVSMRTPPTPGSGERYTLAILGFRGRLGDLETRWLWLISVSVHGLAGLANWIFDQMPADTSDQVWRVLDPQLCKFDQVCFRFFSLLNFYCNFLAWTVSRLGSILPCRLCDLQARLCTPTFGLRRMAPRFSSRLEWISDFNTDCSSPSALKLCLGLELLHLNFLGHHATLR
jgi:hypothetical protein